jgi:hypothetical protein
VGAAGRGALDWRELLADGGGHYVDDVVGVVLLLEGDKEVYSLHP